MKNRYYGFLILPAVIALGLSGCNSSSTEDIKAEGAPNPHTSAAPIGANSGGTQSTAGQAPQPGKPQTVPPSTQ